jgi:transposase
MSKCFREYQPEQTLLLPPSLDDWLPEGHLARFLSEVMGELNLGPIYQSYEEKDGRGQAAYEPLMMLKVLFYGYSIGIASS